MSSSAVASDLSWPDLVERVIPAVVTVEVTSADGEGNGSGFVIPGHDATGSIVVTNAHVVQGAKSLVAVFQEERCVDARILCLDAGTDLAILEADTAPPVTLEPRFLNEVRLAEPVLAIGAPYALSGSVSTGIVSGLNRARPTPDGGLVDMIQTDAAINNGNSGGPLIGSDGRVLGINSQGLVGLHGEALSGLKFAVPVELAIRAYAEVRETGRQFLARGSLGIRTRLYRFTHAQRTQLKQASGAELTEAPRPDSPAAQAQLDRGDIIIQFDGQLVDDPGDLYRLLDRNCINRECRIGFLRNDQHHEATVVPYEKHHDPGESK